MLDIDVTMLLAGFSQASSRADSEVNDMFFTGDKVEYLGRIWNVLGVSDNIPECYDLVTDSGYRLEVFGDLLKPFIEPEITEGSWDIAALARSLRHRR